MSHRVLPDSARPCLWMSAGIVTYRLCDRDFDCERCALDAALRRESPVVAEHEALQIPGRELGDFPDDRRYTPGHSWVRVAQGQDPRLLRFGLDAFAAAIIGRCGGVTSSPAGTVLARGETVCLIDLGIGTLSVGVPAGGTLVEGNRRLQEQANRLVTAPYADGWIADLQAVDVAELDDLMPAEKARAEARFDLQRFRRRVAMQLLVDDAGRVGRTLADGGELLTDLRQMLGGPMYLEMLRELIH
jgi:glycine cleavage system H lipoate-binding protein